MEEFNAKITTSGNQIQECDHPVKSLKTQHLSVSQDRKRNYHHPKSITKQRMF